MRDLGEPVQIAYAMSPNVPVREHANRHAQLWGSGPFVVAEHIDLAVSLVNGAPTPFDHSSAYGWWGDLMVELVVEHTAPLVPPGRVHHVAYMVDSLPAAIEHCRSHGAPVLLEARTRTGTDFVFCDARDELGHLVELYERSEGLLAFYERVRSLARG